VIARLPESKQDPMPTDVSFTETPDNVARPSHGDTRPESNDAVTLLDVLTLLAQRKRMIGLIVVLVVILGVIVALLWPIEFTAATTMLPPQQGGSMASALTAQLSGLSSLSGMAGGSLGLKNPNDMFVALLKSRTVEDGMIHRFGLMQEYHKTRLVYARAALEKHVVIDGSGKDNLIHISFDDPDPNRAAELANGYVDEFRQLSEHLAITEAAQRRLFFEKQLEDAKNNLSNAEEQLKRMEQQTGVIQIDSQARALMEQGAALRAQIDAKEVEIRSLETFATDQNAQLVQAQQELASLRSQLQKLGGTEAGDDPLLVPKGKVPEASLEYVRRLRDVKYYETIFDILARQYEFAKLDEAREGAMIQVVDVAVPPELRSQPKRGLIVVCSVFIGFILGILVAIFNIGFARAQEDPETNRKLLKLRQALAVRSRAG
jgi:tyrosine-protein kinase Etk/Wzc